MKAAIRLFIFAVILMVSYGADAFDDYSISISGVVKQPLNLNMEDLSRFTPVRVQLNEIMKDRSYRGAWFYRGVSLRNLLETSHIQKEESEFSKATDLAILVRNRNGEEVALSWGEIFYKNSDDIIIATSATPIRPKRDCASCHSSNVYNVYMKEFEREIGFPKLVIASDGYADRSIENVVSIEVIDPRPRMSSDSSAGLWSPSFKVTGNVDREVTINSISGLPRKEATVIHMGEGKGYHGIDDFSGAFLKDILERAGVAPLLSLIFHVSAPDGYRASFSYGEIFLNRVKSNTIIADIRNGKELKEDGRFILVTPDDLMSDRYVKSVQKIEVINLAQKPKLTYVGIGCGDTNLITLEAISAIARADVLVASPDMKKRFGKYMGNKPILFDVHDYVPPAVRKKYPDLSAEDVNRKIEEGRAGMAEIIRAELNKGLSVVIMEYGDPTIWSGSEYIMEHIPREMIEIVPGISSFNAANALVKGHIGCSGSMILATSGSILHNRLLFREAAEKGMTLSVFMGMKDLPVLARFFREEAYSAGTTVHLVYRAGYSASEKVIRTDVENFEDIINNEAEKNLFLIYVGPCLESDRAYRHMMY